MTYFLLALDLYFITGIIFAVAFVIRGVNTIDPVAATASLKVRLLWLPGSCVLWPVLLLKWLEIRKASKP